jgi:His/Glu/Gln/Arg/opine family amino acid ABC transporter permease subunit
MGVTSLAAYGPILLKAVGLTIWVSWLSLLIGGFGGLLLALMRISRTRALRLCAILYIEFFRSVPILIVLFFCFYGVPLLFKVDLSAFSAATLALGLHASAMMSEVIRAGIGSVGEGQWEAAKAAGMTYRQMMRHVIGPQAVQVILPPSVGIYIMVLKESSVASIIGYVELTSTGLLIRESVGGGFTILGVVALLYFLLCYSISLAGGALEHRVKIHGRGLPIDELG